MNNTQINGDFQLQMYLIVFIEEKSVTKFISHKILKKMTKRKQTAIKDMYHAIIRLEKNESTQHQIADQVHPFTVSKWMEKDKKEKIKSAFEKNINGQRKRLRTSKYFDLDITVYVWFKRTRAAHPEIGINVPVILKKAEHFAVLHGYTNFKPSRGWLERWKTQYDLRFLKMSG